MPKYLMMYDCGYGKTYSVEEHPDQEQADKAVYDLWWQSVEDNAEYEAQLLTKELAEENGFEDELNDDQPTPANQ